MYISLGALAHNARAIRQALPAHVKMMGVVKADAYGHGALDMAHCLEAAGADALAVALVEEGVELRAVDVKLPILVLGGTNKNSLPDAVKNNISVAIYNADALRALERVAASLNMRAKAHLKIDTGMSRVGVRTDEELREVLDAWSDCKNVDMEGIFTHFCVADEDVEFTQLQNGRFKEALATVRAAGFDPIAHAAATSAALNPEFQHDMVRPGIGLYGMLMPELEGKLRLAQRLVTRPLRIETIRPGDTVGYGRTFTARRETRVMTLPIGYGDGYPRILGNRADVLVRGQRARVIGRVCMDMIMADVTDIPGVSLEDEVVLMGKQGDDCISPEELARHAETIPYEIILGFSRRVRRIVEE